MRCEPRTAVSAFRIASCVAPNFAKICCAASFFDFVAASNKCSVDTYSSLKASASLKACSNSACTACESCACCTPPPETLGSFSISFAASAATCSALMPIFSSTGGTIPSASRTSDASRCTGRISGLPCSEANSTDFCTASCAFNVNLSQRMAIVSPFQCPAFQPLRQKKKAEDGNYRLPLAKCLKNQAALACAASTCCRPTVTLICFSFASAFLARRIFSRPLS